MSTIKVTNVHDTSNNVSLVTDNAGIKTDKLTGNTTAGSISVVGEGNSTTTNLQQGLAKAWARVNGTGTIALRDSFNISSIADNATGTTTATFTNTFSNDEPSTTFSNTSTAFAMQIVNGSDPATIKFRTLDASANLIDDPAKAVTLHGDLA
ncbi:hypothetical protein [uncultured Mediterranean phage]|nr:hypothetical protein [uncultured Mediterranean phage]